MKHTHYLFFVAIAILLVACKPNYEKMTGQMKTLENRLYGPGSTGFDRAGADSLMNIYQKFLDKFPNDTMTPTVVFRMANLALNLGKADTAIILFDRYMKDYPDGPKAEVCMFFKAFVYENFIKDFDKAKELYLQFIQKYPASDFADDAKVAVMNLGKTPDQFFMEFEAKRKADSVRAADSLAGLAQKGTKGQRH